MTFTRGAPPSSLVSNDHVLLYKYNSSSSTIAPCCRLLITAEERKQEPLEEGRKERDVIGIGILDGETD